MKNHSGPNKSSVTDVTFDPKRTQDSDLSSKKPEWLRELQAVLVVYWETGEVSDDIEDEWFDLMIERITPYALLEM